MIFETKGLEYIFKTLKSGDFFGFYKKPWYRLFSRLIAFVTNNKLSHVAGVFDVKRSKNAVVFKLGEQTVFQGRSTNIYSIVAIVTDGTTYNFDSRFTDKHQDLYLLSNQFQLTKEQNQIVKDYWTRKVTYKIKELAFTQNWFYRFFGNKTKVYEGNCSTATRESMALCGIVDSKFDDKVPDPTEFAKFSYIKSITKICF
tara:strand:+ start:99 stop:698 length:600 start_codon:yes stop_codon:yes gene_type:complete